MQIFVMLRHLVAEISRFKFDDYRVIPTGEGDLKLFCGRCIHDACCQIVPHGLC